jgi:hypothetical protein
MNRQEVKDICEEAIMDDCMSVEQAKRRLKSLSYGNIIETDDIHAISIILKILDPIVS